MLTDAHCHLSELSEQELDDVLKEALASGVTTLIAVGAGYGFDDNLKTVNITKKYETVFCALGMHPHDAKDVTDENFLKLKKLISENKKVVSVGEIGLDYHYRHSPEEVQQQVLRRFSQLALEVKKPVMIHDRDCGDDCVNILTEENARDAGGMAHCFTGSLELAKKYLNLGFYISFSGIITFKKSEEVREIVKMVPMDRLLIETDAPFLAPVPLRGQKNQPAYVKYVAEHVAQIKNLQFEEVAKITTENAKSLFGIF